MHQHHVIPLNGYYVCHDCGEVLNDTVYYTNDDDYNINLISTKLRNDICNNELKAKELDKTAKISQSGQIVRYLLKRYNFNYIPNFERKIRAGHLFIKQLTSYFGWHYQFEHRIQTEFTSGIKSVMKYEIYKYLAGILYKNGISMKDIRIVFDKYNHKLPRHLFMYFSENKIKQKRKTVNDYIYTVIDLLWDIPEYVFKRSNQTKNAYINKLIPIYRYYCQYYIDLNIPQQKTPDITALAILYYADKVLCRSNHIHRNMLTYLVVAKFFNVNYHKVEHIVKRYLYPKIKKHIELPARIFVSI